MIHAGNGQHGHYYSLINTVRGAKDAPDPSNADWENLARGKWKKFDDREVTAYQISDLKIDTFGGEEQSYGNSDYAGMDDNWGKSAYMLVYERSSK